MAANTDILYTIGHSQRTLDELMALLAEAGVRCLVDVRRYPGSRRHPHFALDSLRANCDAAGVAYHWAGEQLGGYRPTAADSPHVALPQAFRGYAEYMHSEGFENYIAQLLRRAGRAPTAVMCAEKDPTQCHRALIADYLTTRGVRVVHLIEVGVKVVHALNPHARVDEGLLFYDRLSQGSLPFDR